MKYAFVDQYARLSSPIHRLPVTHKLYFCVGLLGITLVVLPLFPLTTQALGSLSIAVFLWALSWTSTVAIKFLLLRTSLVLPFSGFVILVNAFSGVFDLPQIVLILARSMLSIWTILLLISTTPFHGILAQLSSWGFPKLIILILAFMYRYFFLLMDEIEALERGIRMRHSSVQGWQRIKSYSNIVGMLLIRSFSRAQSVYRAMEMRGFTGDLK